MAVARCSSAHEALAALSAACGGMAPGARASLGRAVGAALGFTLDRHATLTLSATTRSERLVRLAARCGDDSRALGLFTVLVMANRNFLPRASIAFIMRLAASMPCAATVTSAAPLFDCLPVPIRARLLVGCLRIALTESGTATVAAVVGLCQTHLTASLGTGAAAAREVCRLLCHAATQQFFGHGGGAGEKKNTGVRLLHAFEDSLTFRPSHGMWRWRSLGKFVTSRTSVRTLERLVAACRSDGDDLFHALTEPRHTPIATPMVFMLSEAARSGNTAGVVSLLGRLFATTADFAAELQVITRSICDCLFAVVSDAVHDGVGGSSKALLPHPRHAPFLAWLLDNRVPPALLAVLDSPAFNYSADFFTGMVWRATVAAPRGLVPRLATRSRASCCRAGAVSLWEWCRRRLTTAGPGVPLSHLSWHVGAGALLTADSLEWLTTDHRLWFAVADAALLSLRSALRAQAHGPRVADMLAEMQQLCAAAGADMVAAWHVFILAGLRGFRWACHAATIATWLLDTTTAPAFGGADRDAIVVSLCLTDAASSQLPRLLHAPNAWSARLQPPPTLQDVIALGTRLPASVVAAWRRACARGVCSVLAAELCAPDTSVGVSVRAQLLRVAQATMTPGRTCDGMWRPGWSEVHLWLAQSTQHSLRAGGTHEEAKNSGKLAQRVMDTACITQFCCLADSWPHLLQAAPPGELQETIIAVLHSTDRIGAELQDLVATIIGRAIRLVPKWHVRPPLLRSLCAPSSVNAALLWPVLCHASRIDAARLPMSAPSVLLDDAQPLRSLHAVLVATCRGAAPRSGVCLLVAAFVRVRPAWGTELPRLGEVYLAELQLFGPGTDFERSARLLRMAGCCDG